jgi:hypothetical protein
MRVSPILHFSLVPFVRLAASQTTQFFHTGCRSGAPSLTDRHNNSRHCLEFYRIPLGFVPFQGLLLCLIPDTAWSLRCAASQLALLILLGSFEERGVSWTVKSNTGMGGMGRTVVGGIIALIGSIQRQPA